LGEGFSLPLSFDEGVNMQQILQEIVETNAEEEFEFPTVKKQKLNKAKVLEERLLDELPSDDAGEENETI
jgi:hypothetical protein|tara:strand:+ start:656 stop:865 length:210 start_codon:yes stop_codon:yes gene_type:complete